MTPAIEEEESMTMTVLKGNGTTDVEEQRRPDFSRRATLTMSEFFQSAKAAGLDDSAKSLMVKYDKDGDGSFSKEEVAELIRDLQAQGRANADLAMANKILKRILIGAIIFFFLLVASIFGLSFAVANLTKDTTIDSTSGTLYTKDNQVVVSTNSRADIFHAEAYDFGDCLLTSDVVAMKKNVLSGTNVVLQRNSETGKNVTLGQLKATGATMEQDISPTGDVIVDGPGKVCFYLPESNPEFPHYCITPAPPDHPCVQVGAARRLKERAAARALQGNKIGSVAAPAMAPALSPTPFQYERELSPVAGGGESDGESTEISTGGHGCCR